MFELSRIAAMAGHSGLFSVHTALKNGVVLESLDEAKTKMVAGATSKVSILSEISIYTTTSEGSVSLESVLQSLYEKYKGVSAINSKSDGSQLKKFLLDVLPNTDFDRVYVSDIKKLANWYNILVNFAPEVLKPKEEEKKVPSKPKAKAIETEAEVEQPKAKATSAKKKKAEPKS